MKPAVLIRITCLLSGLLALALSGCIAQRSPETRYYLMALPSGNDQAAGSRAITGPRVGIGPISMPSYLERQQIFIRDANATDVKLADYDRWGEDMAEGINRLLVEAISTRIADTGGAAQPLRSPRPADQRISVNVNRFDGAPGAEIVLDVDWALYTIEGDILREGHFKTQTTAEAGIDGLVRAHGELLSQFGDILAAAIRSAPQKPGRR